MSLARAADQAFKLALRVGGIRQSRLDLTDVVEQLEEDWALFPLVHDDGSVGVMCVDPSSNIAFVEQQTMGRVAAGGDEARKLTRTDKALALPFLEGFLRLFDEALEGAPTAYWTRGYRAEDAVETRHLMVLLLDASEYRGFEMKSDVEAVGRTCTIRFFLPIKDPVRNTPRQTKKAKQNEQNHKPKLRNAALAAMVEMDAVMCKVTMPLSELSSLQPGQLLSLPQDASRQAKLQDKKGQTSLPVHLGQLHGMRAVKLASSGMAQPRATPQPSVIEKPEEPQPARNEARAEPDQKERSEPQAAAPPGDELDELLSAGK